MPTQRTPTSAVWMRLATAIKRFARSEVGWKAKLAFSAILALLIGANALNVANSFVNRHLMSAIEERQIGEFIRQAQLTLAVFAGSTIVAVVARFGEERLGLLWREFLTERRLAAYMVNETYHRLALSGELAKADRGGRARLHGHDAFLRAHGDQ
jgi:vitamin B12/bleomycin/antimicrobial peptide transport system ATP-binding/permease protein